MSEWILNIAMITIPFLVALVIHKYLRHGEMSIRRTVFFAVFYLCFINFIVLAVSWMRGVKGLNFRDMTISFKLKYMGMGSMLGLFIPFPICLVTEDRITLSGLKRYTGRFLSDIQKYSPYAVRMAKAELHSEVAGSYLDWLWWLIEPFCTMMIYTLIFGVVFRASEQFFPVFIFIGISIWGFFSRSVSGSVNIIRMNKGIITRVYIPKYILLISRMFVNGFKMLVSFGVVAVMMLVFRVPLTANILFAIPVLLVLFLFTFGIASIMTHYGVYVSDLSYITGIVLSMLMYLTGTFYSISRRIPEPFGEIVEQYNPVAFLIASMRNALLYGKAPSWGLLLLWGFVSLFLIALGVFTIYSNENAYVKVI